jgi:U3 small nucleolar RNA-associated protein 10
MNAFILELLPNLLLMHKNWETPLKMTTLLAESSLTTSHPLLKGLNELVLCDEYQRLREDPGAKNQLVNTNFAFLDWFTENLKLIEDNRPLISLLLGFGRGPVTKSSVCRFVFANFVLSHWIRGMQDRSLQLELSAVLVTAFNQSTPEDHKSDEKLLLPTTPFSVLAFLNKSTKSANLRRLFAVFRLWTMNIIINSIVLPPSAGSIWLTLDAPEQEENWYHFTLLSVLDTLTSRVGNSGGGDSGDDGADGADREGGRPSNAYRTLLQNMLEVQFSGRGWLLRFLALLWTSPSSSTVTVDTMLGGPLSLCVGPILQARGLQIGAAYLSSLDVQSLVAICTTKCPLIPSLLVPLVSPLSTLRQQSIACFRSIHLVVDQLAGGLANEAHSTSPLLHLVTAIVQYSFDIASDPHYFAVVLKGLFHKGSSSESSSRSLRRERGLAAVHSQLMAAITQEGTPIAVQTVLLGNLHLVDHPVKLKESCDLLQKMLCRDQPASEDAKELLEVLIKGFTPKSATVFEEFESGFQSFLSVLGGQHQLLYSSRLQELALMQVSPLFFSSLDTSLQCQLLKAMINSLVSTDDAGMVTLIRSTLQKLPLTADHLSEELKQDFNVLGVVSEEETPRPKRRKRTKEPIYNLLSCRRRLCVVLELSTSLTDLEGGDHWRLVPLLFQLLGHVLDPEDQWEELEYPCQLILTQLTLCCKQLTAMDPAQALKVVPEDVFDVELAVKCIRVSSDTHTQHHAFMLLATAAKLYPSRILHNIMPIFTFMGTSVMRCDNQYSYSIIQQTIDSIIPALMQSPRLHRGKTPSRHTTSGGRTPQTEETIQEVLRVFVDTLPHIPPHRQQPLFIHLLNAVGVGENLHQLWLLLVYKHILLKTKEEKQAAFQYVAFACELADHFHGNSLSAILKLLQHTSSLPFERPQRQLRQARQKVTFDPASHSTRQLLHYQHSLYNLMTLLLSRPNLIQNFSESSNAEETVLQLLEGLLVAMTTQSHVSLSDTTHGKFLISVQQKTEELTQKVTNLLSLDSFLAIMKQLIEESSSLTQLKAFELLGRELQSPRESLTTSHKEQLIVMVSSVKGIAMVKSKRQLNPSTNQIAALHCLGSLSELIAEEFCNEFVDISKDLLGILSRRNVPPEVAGCSLQVISLLVAKIGVQLIPLLTQLVPAILDHVHPNENGSVLGSACGALLSVVSVLANFISPYASSIMKKVCVPAFGPTSSDIDLHLCGVLKNIRKQLGARTPLRILLPVFLSTMEDLKLLGQEEMASCLEVTEECLCGLTPSDVRTHSKLLLDLSHLLLSYRSHHPSVNELECVSFVEKRVVTILGSVVLKMSEASFRPMFLMLFDWATGEGAAKEGLIAFYHFACRMAEVLKGIFLLFAGHTLLNCAELLLQLHSDNEEKVFSEEEKNCLLLSYILQTLLKCFLFSKKQFLTKERFQTLLSPLVSQVSNCLGTTAECDRRLKEDLSPCIAEFGAAVSGRDAFWKQLNQKLLGMTRHTEPKVRVSVLTVLSELYRKLGEEFVILLPETIPYLAELLEDEVEEVEISCRHLISEIEGIVGESIQEYLSTA